MSKDLDHPSLFKAAPVAFFILGGIVRFIFLFILALPFKLYASCPTGVQVSNVPIATALPYCVKFENSSKGGCFVDCTGVCIEFASGSKGPIQTTGVECSVGGGGDGEDGGGGSDIGGPSGTIQTFHSGPTYVGKDNTADISNLFNNLGLTIQSAGYYQARAISGGFISYVGNMKEDVAALKDFAAKSLSLEQNSDINNRMQMQSLSHIEQMLQDKLFNPGDSGGSGGSDNSDKYENWMLSYMGDNVVPDIKGISSNTNGIRRDTAAIKSMTQAVADSNRQLSTTVSTSLSGISGQLEGIRSAIANGGTGSGSGGGSEPGTGGDGIDYSKMPGSENNPMSVAGSAYKSSCNGDNCYFDVPGMERKLEETRKALSDKYDDIARETKEVFSFNLSGAADPLKCLDLFSYQGKSFEVCPPSQDYWQTLAAMMMFIFYFIALMVIFKR